MVISAVSVKAVAKYKAELFKTFKSEWSLKYHLKGTAWPVKLSQCNNKLWLLYCTNKPKHWEPEDCVLLNNWEPLLKTKKRNTMWYKTAVHKSMSFLLPKDTQITWFIYMYYTTTYNSNTLIMPCVTNSNLVNYC